MLLGVGMSVLVVLPAHADTSSPGGFNTVTTSRILDTRSGLGAPQAAIAGHQTLTFTATAGIDGPVSAVALNVTAVGPVKPGFLTVFAAGTTRPVASNLNFLPGENVPNMVVTPVGAQGKVSIYNGSSSTVNILADIHGYFVGGANTGESGTFVSQTPTRFLDTRIGLGAPKGKVAALSTTTVKIGNRGGVPANATAVVANLTAVNPSVGNGYLTAYPGGPLPLASNLNYQSNENRANLALLEIGPDGTISLFSGASHPVDLVIDISGYFVGGTPATDGTFVPSTPFRVFDTREAGGSPAGALTTSKVAIFPADDPTFSIFKAVMVNVTAVQPQSPGFLTTWDGRGSLPSVSSSNFRAKQDVAGSLVVPVNDDGTISIYNGSYGNVDLVVDVTGFFLNLPTEVPNVARPQVAGASQLTKALSAFKTLHKTPAATAVSVTK